MGQVRARQFHEKEARRQVILGAAARLWERSDFSDLSMTQVAKESGLAKGTLYLYFRSKEELFLANAEEELVSWFEEIDEALVRARRELGGAELARLLARSLSSRPRLPRLLAILHIVLERNIEHLTALRFKQFLATRTLRTGRLLERRLPFLSEGQGSVLMLRVHALVLGFWQLADASPVVKELLDAPGLDLFRVDFAESLESSLADLLAGMKESVTPTTSSGG
jgi:AcrR family transcriptional regulator